MYQIFAFKPKYNFEFDQKSTVFSKYIWVRNKKKKAKVESESKSENQILIEI